MQTANELLTFIENSPSSFHVIANFRAMLASQGYTELYESAPWALEAGGKYFVVRNESSILAFRLPKKDFCGFMMSAAHSDSPTFKVKENPEAPNSFCVRLSTEKYGGMLMSTWFDRPLSVAGRLIVRENGRLVTKLVNIDRDLLIIPSVAIHMNRAANDGVKLMANIDTYPLYGGAASKGTFLAEAAKAAGVAEEAICGHDLSLYLRGRGTVLGANGEYIAAPKLDDLECAFACMKGFLAAKPSDSVPVCCVFDNEEVGSATKQGAASTFLPDVLRRINAACGRTEEEYCTAVANSFLVSADNAHAMHPNHPEFSDAQNCPQLGGGVVIKYNASQRYATDAVSDAIFRTVCADAGVPVQTYANRSDLPGGSTLGSIANTKVSLSTVDIGLAQLAMHSAYETAATADLDSLVAAMTELHGRSLRAEGGIFTL